MNMIAIITLKMKTLSIYYPKNYYPNNYPKNYYPKNYYPFFYPINMIKNKFLFIFYYK